MASRFGLVRIRKQLNRGMHPERADREAQVQQGRPAGEHQLAVLGVGGGHSRRVSACSSMVVAVQRNSQGRLSRGDGAAMAALSTDRTWSSSRWPTGMTRDVMRPTSLMCRSDRCGAPRSTVRGARPGAKGRTAPVTGPRSLRGEHRNPQVPVDERGGRIRVTVNL